MKRVLFVLLFILIFLLAGGTLSLLLGRMIWIFIFALLSFLSLFLLISHSSGFLLSILGANPIDRRIAPELCEAVFRVSEKTKVAIMPSYSPNVLLLSGPDSYIVFTDEALSSFSEDEIEAAIVRMISSKNVTLKTWVCATGMVLGYVGFLGKRLYDSGMPRRLAGFLLLPFLYLASLFEGFFFYKKTVFEEDREGALRLGKPEMLAKVIRLCEGASKRKNPRRGTSSLSFLFLVNPYHNSFSELFDFHPRSERRISRLNEVSKTMGHEIV